MNTKDQVYTCRLTTLTPVHTGSGNIYRKNIDYIADMRTGKITGLNITRIFSLTEKNNTELIPALTAACENGRIDDWWLKNRAKFSSCITFEGSLGQNNIPPDIREQQRDGFGNPYLPGSSIKGAIRTAILIKLSSKTPESVKMEIENLKRSHKVQTKFADKPITEKLLGKTPNSNIMRCLSVGDAVFQNVKPALGIAKTASMKTNGGYGYKTFFTTLECIRSGSTASFHLAFDHYLTGDKESERLGFETTLDINWIKKAVREFTEKLINHEMEFCGKQLAHKELENFYKTVLPATLKGLKDNEIILNLGWGIGWEGMTGGLIPEEMMDRDLRRKLRLADKRLDSPFPKTRKVAILDGRITPWGWVKIEFLPYDRNAGIPIVENQVYPKDNEYRDLPKREQVPPTQTKDIKEPVDPSENIIIRIDALSPEKIAGTAKNFVDDIERLQSTDAKVKAAKHFMKKISEEVNKKANKKFREKEWYKKLEKMSGE